MHSTCKHSTATIAGTSRWGEYGEGGLLWGECIARHFEWFEGDPVIELLLKAHIISNELIHTLDCPFLLPYCLKRMHIHLMLHYYSTFL